MKLTITGTRIPKGGPRPQRNTRTSHAIKKNRRYVKPRGWRPWRPVIRETHKELLQTLPWEKLRLPLS